MNRDNALDFTKGFLVVVMSAYHLLNYFFKGGESVYYYLNYVSGAFIFISGLICSTLYYKKFVKNSLHVHYRLFSRGVKLIVIFFAVNIAMRFFVKSNYSGQDISSIQVIFQNIGYILIYGSKQLMAFEILLPIAYVLLAANLFLYSVKFKKLIFFAIQLLLILIPILFGSVGYNAKNFLLGMGGFYTGFVFPDLFSQLKKPFVNYIIMPVLFIYFFIVIPLGARVPLFIYYVIINTVLIAAYKLGGWLNPRRVITKYLIFFGKYSLFMYLAQIFILQILFRLIKIEGKFLNLNHLLLFVGLNLLLLSAGYLIEIMRLKYRWIDSSYKLIFA